MSHGLPIQPEIEQNPTSDNGTVVELGDNDIDSVIDALGSDTARQLLDELLGEQKTPAALADSLDCTVQNVHYHLSRLTDAGLVRAVGTAYSSRGLEMDIYTADSPLVVVLGPSDEEIDPPPTGPETLSEEDTTEPPADTDTAAIPDGGIPESASLKSDT